MKKFKVVKTEGLFEKGDVFVENNNGTFSFEYDTKESGFAYNCVVKLSADFVKNAVEKGTMIEMCDCSNDKAEKAISELESLANAYKEDLDYTLARYQAGESSECEKAEAVTVLSNLLKLTERIKTILK